jgi:hypothetical protein
MIIKEMVFISFALFSQGASVGFHPQIEEGKPKQSCDKTFRFTAAMDILSGAFFCGFLIFFTVFSYIHWAVAAFLVFVFLVKFALLSSLIVHCSLGHLLVHLN